MQNKSPKPFVFVLMPFHKAFDDIYQLGIKAACSEADAYCERVDEQYYDGSMLDRIYNQISRADVIVSDLTGRNPNVFYETGYAHALGKRVILLTQNAEDIPFDLKHYHHITYSEGITQLKKTLTERLRWAIQNQDSSPRGQRLQIFVERLDINTSPEIIVSGGKGDKGEDGYLYYKFLLSVHNIGNEEILAGIFYIGVILDERQGEDKHIYVTGEGKATWMKKISLTDGKILYMLPGFSRLFPHAGDSFNVGLRMKEPCLEDVVIRAFWAWGYEDYNFRIIDPTYKNSK